jgi:hypothetical protein
LDTWHFVVPRIRALSATYHQADSFTVSKNISYLDGRTFVRPQNRRAWPGNRTCTMPIIFGWGSTQYRTGYGELTSCACPTILYRSVAKKLEQNFSRLVKSGATHLKGMGRSETAPEAEGVGLKKR